MLVDCTRGLCALDWRLVRRAERNAIACQVVLTKADLLSPTDLARSHAVVAADLRLRASGGGVRHPQPAMVSSNFTQGVRQIWALARHHALTRAPPGPAIAKQSGRSRARAEEADRLDGDEQPPPSTMRELETWRPD